MNQQILDDLIGAPPPSTVDVGAIIVRQRRRQRVRRIAASASAAAGVVLAVVLGVSMAGGARRPDSSPPATAPPSPTASPTASPSATGFALETGTEAGRERTKDRLRAALEKALAEHAPDAKWIYMPDVPGEKPTPDGHPAMWVDDAPVFFEGRSGISAGGGKGGFHLSVRPSECEPGLPCSAALTCDDLSSECSTARTPGGLDVVRWVEKSPGGDQPYLSYGVQVMLRGGTYTLTLRAVNVFGGDASPIRAPAPTLTRTQLEKMAADVAERITG